MKLTYDIMHKGLKIGQQVVRVDKVVEPHLQRFAIELFKKNHPIWIHTQLTAVRAKRKISPTLLLAIGVIIIIVIILKVKGYAVF